MVIITAGWFLEPVSVKGTTGILPAKKLVHKLGQRVWRDGAIRIDPNRDVVVLSDLHRVEATRGLYYLDSTYM